jgi:hypothetical protein
MLTVVQLMYANGDPPVSVFAGGPRQPTE